MCPLDRRRTFPEAEDGAVLRCPSPFNVSNGSVSLPVFCDGRLGRQCALLLTFFLAVAISGPRHGHQERRHNSEIGDESRQIGSGGKVLDGSHVGQ